MKKLVFWQICKEKLTFNTLNTQYNDFNNDINILIGDRPSSQVGQRTPSLYQRDDITCGQADSATRGTNAEEKK